MKQAREWGRSELLVAGIESSQLDSDVVLASVLRCSRAQLFSRSDAELSGAERQAFQALIARRAADEPVAYLLGVREFYGREFEVSPAVLIPRPETELLVDRTIAVIREFPEISCFYDIGTGSGAVLLSALAELQQERSELRGIGVDISPAALRVAGHNAKRLGLLPRVGFIEGSLISGVVPSGRQPLLVAANLPYIPQTEQLPRTVVGFEPAVALWGGGDGLDLVWQLILGVSMSCPVQGAILLLEIGDGQAPLLVSRTLQLKDVAVSEYCDLRGVKRVVEVRFGAAVRLSNPRKA